MKMAMFWAFVATTFAVTLAGCGDMMTEVYNNTYVTTEGDTTDETEIETETEVNTDVEVEVETEVEAEINTDVETEVDTDIDVDGREPAPEPLPETEPEPTDEICNGVDDDGDGLADEGLLVMFYLDRDGDGYGDPGWLMGYTCPDNAQSTWVANRGDCDDTDETIHADTGCPRCETIYWRDGDGDGYGDPMSGGVFSCQDGSVAGYITAIGDCNDSNPDVHVRAVELCDGLDNDCDGEVDEECEAEPEPEAEPSAEICNGVDDDGDGETDEAHGVCTYLNASNGEYLAGQFVCGYNSSLSYHYASCTPCCDEVDDPSCAPCVEFAVADEFCDNEDNNGNGLADEELYQQGACVVNDFPATGTDVPGTWYCAHTADGAFWSCSWQCSMHEVCDDGLDNDCDGEVDEGCGDEPETEPMRWCTADRDGDGCENSYDAIWVASDEPCPDGYISGPAMWDCDDSNPDVHVGAVETCDGVDNDCDDEVDEGCEVETEPVPEEPCTTERILRDADGDGYGDPENFENVCAGEPLPEGFALWIVGRDDCNDTDPEVNPGVVELIGDGVDNDCDGNVDAIEACDGIDNNGDGIVDSPMGMCSVTVDGVPSLGLATCRFNLAHHWVIECQRYCWAAEWYDGLDSDCDGEIDEGCEEDEGTRFCDGD